MLEVEPPAEDITLGAMKRCSTPTSANHDDKFGVPTLEELGKELHCGNQFQVAFLFTSTWSILFL